MEQDTEIMSTQEAAAYLEMKLATFKYHIKKRHVEYRVIGRTRLFTRSQLDAFRATMRAPGRPKKPRAMDGLD